MRTMKIFLHTDNVWYVVDSSPKVKALFGTDTLPLPWIGPEEGRMAMESLRELNPDATVTLGEVDTTSPYLLRPLRTLDEFNRGIELIAITLSPVENRQPTHQGNRPKPT